MVKLSGLIDGMAAALQTEPARVRTAAAQLRKHKLLTTGPRGPGAPDMTPEDATNLLLALMYDGEAAKAHENVARLREATFVRSEGIVRGGERLPSDMLAPNRFLRDTEGNPLPFGYVLDTMLDWWLRGGSIEEEDCEDGGPNLYAAKIRLTVSSPGYRARLFIDAYDVHWQLDYECKPPEQLEYEAAATTEGFDFRPRWDALNGPYMSASRVVGEDNLTAIADCLRGRPWDDLEDLPADPEVEALG